MYTSANPYDPNIMLWKYPYAQPSLPNTPPAQGSGALHACKEVRSDVFSHPFPLIVSNERHCMLILWRASGCMQLAQH